MDDDTDEPADDLAAMIERKAGKMAPLLRAALEHHRKQQAEKKPIYTAMEADIMRSALGPELFELARDEEARRRRLARREEHRKAWLHLRAVANGRKGGIRSGEARRAKRDARLRNEA